MAVEDQALAQLERQAERAGLFTHTALGQTTYRLNEVESFAYALVDLLLSKQVVSQSEVAAAVEQVRREMSERGEMIGPGLVLRADPPEAATRPATAVNCAERMHICHSVCCKLDFPLTQEEIEAGHVRWDLGRPYHIRHEEHGHCTHRNTETGSCGVYENRPGICRTYTCAHDERIWKNFEKMELNREWLETNLNGCNRPRMLGAVLYQIERAPATPEPNRPEQA